MSASGNESPTEVIFLADAHLKGPDDPNQQAFIDFLDRIDPVPGAIVILGDVFEFFSGRNRAAEAAYRPVLQRLERFAPFHFTEGNHDYDLSSDIPELSRVLIHPGPIDTRLHGVTIRLEHGDRADPFDLGTKLLRAFLQSAPARWLRDRVLPQDWLFHFGLSFARASRRRVWWDAKMKCIGSGAGPCARLACNRSMWLPSLILIRRGSNAPRTAPCWPIPARQFRAGVTSNSRVAHLACTAFRTVSFCSPGQSRWIVISIEKFDRLSNSRAGSHQIDNIANREGLLGVRMIEKMFTAPYRDD